MVVTTPDGLQEGASAVSPMNEKMVPCDTWDVRNVAVHR